MSLSWPAVNGTQLNLTVNTLGAIGTGAYTFVALIKPADTTTGAYVGAKVSSSYSLEMILDTGAFFGAGDFTLGFSPSGLNATDWQIVGQGKASGSNPFRWHYWNYTTNSAKTHADSTSNHANPGTITAITLGQADNQGRGLIAVIGIWKRNLSDADFNSLCTTNLSDWAALSPDALYPMNVAAASVVDVTGNGNDVSSVGGTISSGADPPSFNYALSVSGTAAAALGRVAATAIGTPTTLGTAAATLGGLTASAAGTPIAVGSGLIGDAHGPLPLAPGSIVVHTGTIAGAIT